MKNFSEECPCHHTKYGLWEYNRCKTQCCKSNGRMLQKIPRINKKSPEFRIDFMAANRYNLGT